MKTKKQLFLLVVSESDLRGRKWGSEGKEGRRIGCGNERVDFCIIAPHGMGWHGLGYMIFHFWMISKLGHHGLMDTSVHEWDISTWILECQNVKKRWGKEGRVFVPKKTCFFTCAFYDRFQSF